MSCWDLFCGLGVQYVWGEPLNPFSLVFSKLQSNEAKFYQKSACLSRLGFPAIGVYEQLREALGFGKGFQSRMEADLSCKDITQCKQFHAESVGVVPRIPFILSSM